MDGSDEPLLPRSGTNGEDDRDTFGPGRTIDLPPLRPSTGPQSLAPSAPSPERIPSKPMSLAEENVVGERVANPYSSAAASGSGTASLQLPILSGPPPLVESDECRTCGKSFIPLFRKAHPCSHCGYAYCSDHGNIHCALMPRRGVTARQAGGSNSVGVGVRGGGYEMSDVCEFCYPMLQIASGNASYLRTLPLKKLQQFIKAYNLNPAAVAAIEKEDFVQLIIKAKDPRTGCMPAAAESFYRRRSVPKQGVLPPPPSTNNARSTASARPPPGPTAGTRPPSTTTGQATRPPPQQPQPQYGQRPPTQPPARNGYQARPPPQAAPRPPQPTPRPTASKPRPAPAPKRQPPPPVPTLSSLVPLPLSYITSLSIGTLKAILYENHVKVNFAQVLEKGELINRVQELIKVERKRLERIAKEEEAEAAAQAALRSGPESEDLERRPSTDGEQAVGSLPRASIEMRRSPPEGPPSAVERDGLCVVCQDEDAELAVVDCGHLSMCQPCSKLIMSTSKECPLCRTRIITEARLIRIFRT